jgi:hypothetical protein
MWNAVQYTYFQNDFFAIFPHTNDLEFITRTNILLKYEFDTDL